MTAYSAALGWQAQLVSYPLFTAVGPDDFAEHHTPSNAAIPVVLILPGFLTFLAGTAFYWTRPPDVPRPVAALLGRLPQELGRGSGGDPVRSRGRADCAGGRRVAFGAEYLREARAVVLARTCRPHVVFASFAGPTGDVFTETAGCSAIWSPDGLAVARTGPDVGNTAATTLT